MEKHALLKQVTDAALAGIVTKAELIAAYDKSKKPATKKPGVSEVFAYLGGGIIFLGIAIFVSQNWEVLDLTTRLLLTLVVGAGAFVSAVLLDNTERTKAIAPALHLVAALTLPIGVFVAFDAAGLSVLSVGTQLFVWGVLLMAYCGAYIALHKTMFAFFAIIFGTLLYFSAGDFFAQDSAPLSAWDYYAYLSLAAGLSYCFLGYTWPKLKGFLYGFGIFGVLASGLALGGWNQAEVTAWDLIYPFLLATTLWFSVRLKSQSFLVFGSLFTVLYIFKITAEYFSSLFGWPLLLALIGLVMIGVSLLAINLRKRFAKK